MSEEELLLWNSLGLIPGPDEGVEEYTKRARFCLICREQIKEAMAQELGEESDPSFSRQLIIEASGTTKKLYDVIPEWVPIIFSNYGLAYWHGGCAWIIQLSTDTPTTAFLQLRLAFEASSRYLGFYEREELIAHESAHIGRMQFMEPKFEEILAYLSAKTPFRRCFGAIIESPWEGMAFIFTTLLCLVIAILSLYFQSTFFFFVSIATITLPLVLAIFGIGRLFLRMYQFRRCLSVLNNLLRDEDKAHAVIYRLTDLEIISFGKMQPNLVMDYAKKQQCLRWRVIRLAYL